MATRAMRVGRSNVMYPMPEGRGFSRGFGDKVYVPDLGFVCSECAATNRENTCAG